MQDEHFQRPKLDSLNNALKTENLVESTVVKKEENPARIEVTTKEGYIIYVTETGTEYKGKGEVKDKTDENPQISIKETETNNLQRKTDIAYKDLFEIEWANDGGGTVKYSTIGKLNFNNIEINDEKIDNIKDLEIGTYQVICTAISPSNQSVTAEKEVKITSLADTTVTDSNNNVQNAKAIYSEYDIAYFRDLVNGGQNTLNAKLMNDINMEKVCSASVGNWKPIGNTIVKYSGIFDGNNKIIDYINIDSADDYQGLFGYTENNFMSGIIIGNNSNIKGHSKVGAIAGYIENATLKRCGNNGSVIGTEVDVGGVVGTTCNSIVTEVYNKGKVTGNKQVGGIIGNMEISTTSNKLTYAYNNASVTGGFLVGGIVGHGRNYASIYNCYNSGKIESTSKSEASGALTGGVVGKLRAYAECKYCFNSGEVENKGTGIYVGGICGILNATPSGTISDESAKSVISYCYNNKNVASNGAYTGGIIGYIDEYCFINDSYTLSSIIVKYGNTSATSNRGTKNNYLGKLVGDAFGTGVTSNVSSLSSVPTIYNVVNNLSDEESKYWLETNKIEPQLIWE